MPLPNGYLYMTAERFVYTHTQISKNFQHVE